jgi:hypothetical protein
MITAIRVPYISDNITSPSATFEEVCIMNGALENRQAELALDLPSSSEQ